MKKILLPVLLFAFVAPLFAQHLDRAEIFEGSYEGNANVRTDDSGNIYVYVFGFQGGPANISLDTNVHNIQNGISSSYNYLIKYNAQGNFLWQRNINGYCYLADWEVDHKGNVYFTGRLDANGSLFIGSQIIRAGPNGSAFIAKQNAAGIFEWADTLHAKGWTSSIAGQSVAIDDSGNVYGIFLFNNGTYDFDFGVGVDTLSSLPNSYASCIVKLDSAGDHIWAKNLQEVVEPFHITLDKDKNIYLTGRFTDTTDFDPGPGTNTIIPAAPGNRSGFILKLDSNANFLWAKTQDALNGEIQTGPALPDTHGNVYTHGAFTFGANFEHGTSTHILYSSSSVGGYVLKLSASGTFGWAKQGFVSSYVENGVYCLNHDFNLIKQNSNGDTVWSKMLNGTQQMALSQYAITGYYLDAADNLFVAGWVYDTIQFFREGIDTTYLIANPHDINMFLTKWHLCSANSSIDTTVMQGSYLILPSGDTVSAPGVYIDTISITGNCDNIITTTLNTITGITTAGVDGNFSITPNPASNQLNINLGSLQAEQVSIYNVDGKLLTQTKQPANNRIDISNLANGVYIAEVKVREAVQRVRWVKM